MPLMRLAILTCLAIVSAAAPAPVSAQSTGLSIPSEAMLNRRGLTRRWWGHAAMNSRRDKLLFMTVDERFLFMQSSTGVVTAFDCETGKQLWARSVGLSDRAIQPATMNDDMLFIINGLRMFAVHKVTGDIAWELTLPGQPATSAVADDDLIYVGCLDGSMYAFDLETIQDLYSKKLLPQFTPQTIKWRFRTSHPIVAPPLPEGNFVAFASKNGSVYTVLAKERKLIFQFETDAALSAPMLHYRNQLLVASEDAHFYSLNTRNGRSAWEFATGDVIRKTPILIEDEVYLLPDQGRLFKLSAATGEQLWPEPKPRTMSFLAASTRHLFVVGHGNTLQILSRDSGAIEGEFPLERFTVHLTNDRNDRIYLATTSGLVMCLHELGRDFPRFHLHPDREPLLPDVLPEGEAAAATPADAPAEESGAEQPAADDSK